MTEFVIDKYNYISNNKITHWKMHFNARSFIIDLTNVWGLDNNDFFYINMCFNILQGPRRCSTMHHVGHTYKMTHSGLF